MNQDTHDKTRDGQAERRHCQKAWTAYYKLKRLKIAVDRDFYASKDYSPEEVSEKLKVYKALKQKAETFQDKYIYRIDEFMDDDNLIELIESIKSILDDETEEEEEDNDNDDDDNEKKINKLKDIVSAKKENPKRYLDQVGFERFVQRLFNLENIKTILESNPTSDEILLINSIIVKFLNSNQSQTPINLRYNLLKPLIDEDYFLPNLEGNHSYEIEDLNFEAFRNSQVKKVIVTGEKDDESSVRIFENNKTDLVTVKKTSHSFALNQIAGTIEVNEAGDAVFYGKKGGISIIRKTSNYCFEKMQGGIALALLKFTNTLGKNMERGTLIAASRMLTDKCRTVNVDPNSLNQPLILFNKPTKSTFDKNHEIAYADYNKSEFTFPYYHFDNAKGIYWRSAYKEQPNQDISSSPVIEHKPEIITKENFENYDIPHDNRLIIFDTSPENISEYQRHNEFLNKIIVYQTIPGRLNLGGYNNVIIFDIAELLAKDVEGNYQLDKETVQDKINAIRRKIRIDCKYPPNSPTPDMVLLRIPDPDDPKMTTFEVLNPEVGDFNF
jgi:hypothetical protein